MTWWQTLLIAISTPAVTAAALIWQNRVNNDRDRNRLDVEMREREQERLAAVKMQGIARTQVIEDHWRDERRRAHSAFLNEVESATSILSRQIFGARDEEHAGPGLMDHEISKVRARFAEVEIVGSIPTQVSARELFDALLGVNFAVFTFQAMRDERWSDDDRARRDVADARLADLHGTQQHYVAAVRQELGTAASA